LKLDFVYFGVIAVKFGIKWQ